VRARDAGCAEALLCLGDKPELVFPTYRTLLEGFGHEGTVDYLVAAGEVALRHGLLPHTNAGILTREDMARLKAVNVSLGLMLESASARLCEPGMPHHAAPDKRPEVRLRMIEEAGELAIPFTTGILIGIGETRRERIEALLAIRDLHRKHGHIQEVIVQNFRATEGVPMRAHPEPSDAEIAHAVAMARLILDPEISVQAPPNLNADGAAMLLEAGINDFGGISPVSPDYINPRHPWPHLEALADVCARGGYSLAPRAAIYDRYVDREGFLDPALATPTARVRARLSRVARPSDLAASARDESSHASIGGYT
jgi:FO synthase